MATLTIRQVEEELRDKLRIRAAQNGRSMEAELRVILRDVLSPADSRGWASRFNAEVVAHTGGVDLDLPDRSSHRPTVVFDE